jgi:hypothetical protein
VNHRAGRLCLPALAVAACWLAACGGSTGVTPGGERNNEVSERAVTIEGRYLAAHVTERSWGAPPQRVLLHHTPIWVSIRNVADEVVRVDPEAWSLVVGAEDGVPAVAPERLVATSSGSLGETRVIRAEGLRLRSLQPGQAAKGFVFFRRRFSTSEQGQPVALRIVLYDAGGTRPLESLDVPLQVGP